jgi:hypothetical protein
MENTYHFDGCTSKFSRWNSFTFPFLSSSLSISFSNKGLHSSWLSASNLSRKVAKRSLKKSNQTQTYIQLLHKKQGGNFKKITQISVFHP